MSEITSRFPWKLHQVLDIAERNGQESIISWLPNGLAFKVHDRERFVQDIMKVHFNQTIFKSFQRQLNLWGFERISTGHAVERGAYCHPLFVKGRAEICRFMIRVKIKGSKSNKTETPRIMPSWNHTVMAGITGSDIVSQLLTKVAASPASLRNVSTSLVGNDNLALSSNNNNGRQSVLTADLLECALSPFNLSLTPLISPRNMNIPQCIEQLHVGSSPTGGSLPDLSNQLRQQVEPIYLRLSESSTSEKLNQLILSLLGTATGPVTQNSTR